MAEALAETVYGRPRAFRPEDLTPEFLRKAEALAAQGLNTQDIAVCLGISKHTYYKYIKDPAYAALPDAIEQGQAKGIAKITAALVNTASNGNVQAQTFYLKNRRPNEWQDKTEVTHNIRTVDIGIFIDDADDGAYDEAGDTFDHDPTHDTNDSLLSSTQPLDAPDDSHDSLLSIPSLTHPDSFE